MGKRKQEPISEPRLTPYPYQEADIKKIVKAGGSALVVSEVGGGKTIIATEVGLRIKAKTIMVIAPKGTHKRGWIRTIMRQDPTAMVRKLDSSKVGKAALADLQWGEPGWYICTPQWFARQASWKNFKPDLAIFDEIHIAGAYDNKTRIKLHQLQAGARIGLSGTPLRNKFENAWSIVRWIFPECMPKKFYAWRRTECAGKYHPFEVQNWKVTGELKPGTLVNSLPCYIQHLQRGNCCEFHPNGFLADLEEPEEIVRTVEMTPAQKRFYKQMSDHYVAWLTTPDETGKLPVVASLPVVARGMLRFCALALPSIDPDTNKLYFAEGCESPKIDELFNILDEMGDAPAIVYTHSQKFAAEVVRRLSDKGISSFEWSGNATQRARDAALEDFIAGKMRIVVAVISAVGTGTDGLQEAASTEIWLSEDDDGTTNQQGRGRLDRPGQTNRVVRIRVQAEGTFDQGIVDKQLEAALKMSATLKKRT